MGADGWITILDANECDRLGFHPHSDFNNVYEQTFRGFRMYTVYADTEDHEEGCDGEHTMNDYHRRGLVVDEWRVWS